MERQKSTPASWEGWKLMLFGAAATVLAAGGVARANIDIVPTFDHTITSDANASTIEAAINATIGRVENDIANPITVNIYFKEMSSGLGASETLPYGDTYSDYRGWLANNQNLSPDDNIALSNLPTTVNPATGLSTTGVLTTTALLRALGQSTPELIKSNGSVSFSGTYDGIVSLNTSLCNLSRTGAQNSSKYDLQAVAGHEMDEVLGIGGAGSNLSSGQTPPTDYTGALDLYRYSANGVRSYTTDATKNAYFSINGGATNFVYFDQNNEGADFADWGNGTPNAEAGNTPPQMQDSFGTPGVDVDIGSFEVAALDVVGYDLTEAGTAEEATITASPEPASTGLLLISAVGLLAGRRRNFSFRTNFDRR